jgi:MoxR-like ATPase
MDPKELNELIEKVETLLGNSDRVEILSCDPRIAPLMKDLHLAKVRVKLSTAAGIVMGQQLNGGTDANGNSVDVITLSRINGKRPAAQVPAATPVAPAATPTPAPAAKPMVAQPNIPAQQAAPAPAAPGTAVGPTPAPAAAPTAPKPEAPRPAAKPQPKRSQHTYRAPAMVKDVIDVIADEASHVVWFKGPTGCGKTVAAHYIAQALDRQLFQLNCHFGMGPESMVGERTIAIDEKSGQNFIKYQEGIVVKAMTCGLDKDGNETGRPGLLFIDEAGAMPTQIAILLNRLLESDDPRRTITLEHDGGRIVRSHSGFRIILAANTCGRGANSMADAMYTAQTDALDISLLNRIAAVFKFGYDREVEQNICMEKVGDDKVARNILQFRDKIREYIKAGRLSTPFSTRHIVKIADMYRIFRDVPKAVYLAVMEQLLPQEMALYNETIVAMFGVDISKNSTAKNVDYM